MTKTRRALRRTIPHWLAVQRAEDAGRTLISLWRDYAAHAAQPYALSAFRKEFRKWQSAAPADPPAEYVASDRYWHGRASPRPDILVLGNGAVLRARGGRLEIFNRGKMRVFDPGPHHRKPKAIILAGWGGAFTTHAARFCIDHKITVLVTGWLGDLTTFIAPRPIQDAALVRSQCSAPLWHGFPGKGSNSHLVPVVCCRRGLLAPSGIVPAASVLTVRVTLHNQRHAEPCLCPRSRPAWRNARGLWRMSRDRLPSLRQAPSS